jgi:predicted nucleic acid-binding protein
VICLDSSVVIKLIVDEEQSDLARALYEALLAEETPIIAPPLLPIELPNVLHKRTRRENGITLSAAMRLFEAFLATPIVVQDPPGLHRRALHLAGALGPPATDDAHYLALSEFVGCEFWTADQRLERQAAKQLPFVRWLGNYAVPLSREP